MPKIILKTDSVHTSIDKYTDSRDAQYLSNRQTIGPMMGNLNKYCGEHLTFCVLTHGDILKLSRFGFSVASK